MSFCFGLIVLRGDRTTRGENEKGATEAAIKQALCTVDLLVGVRPVSISITAAIYFKEMSR